MTSLTNDLALATRIFRRAPGFAALAIAVLAIGIGANTAIFSVVKGVLLSPLPYDEPERIVIFWERNPSFGMMSIAYPNYLDWRREARTMDELAVYRRDLFNLTGAGEPEQVRTTMVSANLFRALGVEPLHGRGFLAEEDAVGGARVAMLSNSFWSSRFGADPEVVGRTVELDGHSYEIVGVLPARLRHPSRSDLFVPIGQFSATPSWTNRGNHPGIFGLGRLAPGVTLAVARQEIESIAAGLAERYPDTNANNSVDYESLAEYSVRDVRPRLYLLSGAVGLVLLIACVNVANLLLVRLAGRERELAIRVALGAGRWRLTRLLLAESTLLAVAGGVIGVGLARGGIALLSSLYAPALPSGVQVGIDAGGLAFTLGMSLATGLLFGLAPALARGSHDVAQDLRAGGRGGQSVERRRTRSALAVAETALAIVLLVGAGLLIKSFGRVLDVDPGFEPEGVLTAEIRLPPQRYEDEEDRRLFWTALVERTRALPGVVDAGITDNLPFVGGNQTSFAISGRPIPEVGFDRPFAEYADVDPGYFSTVGMRLLRGRLLEPSDRTDAQRTMVVDEMFARQHWPDSDPIGQAIVDGDEDVPENRIRIVGVVATVRHNGLDVEPPRPQMYFPLVQDPPESATLVLRSALDPGAIAGALRGAVRELDPNQPISSLRSMGSIIDESLVDRRLMMSLLGVFAAIAVALALVGIFGVVSYGVAQRTQEFGVRMALGADALRVLRLVLREVALIAGVGCGIGLAGAALATRLLESQLYGVGVLDVSVLAAVVGAVLFASLLAGLAPAVRAAGVAPASALREE